MENYIFWSILSALVGGLYTFTHKVIAERNYDTNLSNIYGYSTATVLAFFYCISVWAFQVSLQQFLYTLVFAFINLAFFYFSILTRVESMKNIDTVIFFPLYKTFWPIIITLVSILGFSEVLSPKEALGIITGITVPLLLITKTEHRIQKNLYLWISLVIVTALATSISSVAVKMVYIFQGNSDLFLFLGLLFWIIFSSSFYHFRSKKHIHKAYKKEGIIPFSIIAWVLHFWGFITFIKAMDGNLAIAFTINSFSILIPIILSIIFYKEHFNFRKGCVIVLSIISILLFI